MITKFNYYRQVESPTMYLCNPDGRFLCALEATERKLSLRFNDLSEITLTVNSAHIDKVAYGLVERRRSASCAQKDRMLPWQCALYSPET